MDSAPRLVEARPSAIHGLGGFARQSIPAGAAILEYRGERIGKEETNARCARGNACIFYLDETWNVDGDVESNPARFLNHSCAPNAVAERSDGRIWIRAARLIAAGEEITFNYGYDLIDYREHPCHCGAPNCVGYIVAEEFFGHFNTR